MGVTSSKSKTNLSLEQQDIQYLGNLFPFGDSELKYLHNVYHELLLLQQQQQQQQNDTTIRTSFIQDLSKFCYLKQQQQSQQINDSNNVKNQQQQQQQQQQQYYNELIQTVERDILPCNFGNRLYEAVFVPSEVSLIEQQQKQQQQGDGSLVPNYFALYNSNANKKQTESLDDGNIDNPDGTRTTTINNNNNNNNDVTTTSMKTKTINSNNNLTVMDEYTRKSYLESFFRGLAVTSRRGSRAAVKAMFLTCQPMVSLLLQQNNTTNTNNIAFTNTTTLNNNNNNNNNNENNNNNPRIRAIELVDMGYRLALATAYLQHRDHNDDEEYCKDQDEGEEEKHDEIKEKNNNNEEEEETVEILRRERFIPDKNKTTSDDNNDYPPAITALANSILECARSRYQRSGVPGCLSTPHPDIETNHSVELEDIYEWIDNVAPLFGSILPSFMQTIIFPPRTTSTSIIAASNDNITNNNVRTSFTMPSVPPNSSEFFVSSTSPLLFSLGCLSPSLSSGTPYHRLYTSVADGLSFNRLQNAVLGYSGPTLFIIRATKPNNSTNNNKNNLDSIFGAFTGSPWKESKDFYGNTDCFLYQLSPCTAVYRPKGNQQNFMYCNSNARSRGYDQQAHGIGFGGTVHQPRLFLEEGFDNCLASSRDLTFENGHLLPNLSAQQQQGIDEPNMNQNNFHFDIDTLEVWGVGSDDTINAGLVSRMKQREVTNEAIRRARKVDKAQFLDDLQSGMIESKAFKHRTETDGRADVDMNERFLQMKKNMK